MLNLLSLKPTKHIIQNGKGKPLEIYDCGYLVFSEIND